jgi:hypothetical protein
MHDHMGTGKKIPHGFFSVGVPSAAFQSTDIRKLIENISN